MLGGYYEAGGGQGNPKYLTRKGLSYYVRGEFELFKLYLKYVIRHARDAAQGNRFVQGLHDGGTLADKKKRLAFGIQFIDVDWKQNHVICLAMSPLSDSSAGPTAKLLRKIAIDRMGMEFDDTIACLAQDKAASAVAKALELEVEHCDMHQLSKISESAVGVLVRRKNKKVVNPFPAGETVMKTAHDMGKYFSYSTRHDALLECCRTVGAAEIRIKLDINGTRITAKHGLLHSILRLNKSLKLYAMKNNVDWSLDTKDWDNVRFFEGILSVAGKAFKIVQHEKVFLGSLACVVKMDLLKRLRKNSIAVVDIEAVTASSRMPRKEMLESDLSDVARECLKRARLEAERRYCGNESEDLTNGEFRPSNRELGATLLGLRTVNAKNFSCEKREAALKVLKEEYVSYGETAFKFRASRKPDLTECVVVEPQAEVRAESANPTPLSHNVSSARTALDSVANSVSAARSEQNLHCDANLPPDSEDVQSSESEEDLGMDSWGVPLEVEEKEEIAEEMPDYRVEFDQVWGEWVRFAHEINWMKEFGDGSCNSIDPSVKRIKTLEHLMPLNIGKLYKKLEGDRRYGHLPAMARSSRCNIGALGAQSFCERIISAGNIVMTDGNTLLSSDELDMMVVLRTNRNFMCWARENFSSLQCGTFNSCVIPEKENSEDSEL